MLTPSQQKRAAHKARFKAVGDELARLRQKHGPDIQSLCWMARNGELLPPSPVPVDDPALSSRLYGPSMKTVQLERVEVTELDEDGRVVWRA